MGVKLLHKNVEQYFLDNNCKLLDKYLNIRQKLNYICCCGNKSIMTFHSFKKVVDVNIARFKNKN